MVSLISSSSSSLVVLAALCSQQLVAPVEAFSTSRRQLIELTNPLNNPRSVVSDRLPVSFISQWPTWVLSTNGELSRIPSEETEGFCQPSSVDELWHPVDLRPPQCQLALGLHVRDGAIRHLFPALDLSFDGGLHRNRGLCSLPRAFRWVDFSSVMAGRLNGCALLLETRNKNESEWETLLEVDSIEDAVSRALHSLAGEPPKELGEGSAFVHVIISDGPIIECPNKSGSEMRAFLLEDDDHVLGALQVSIEKTAAGCESEYLPKAYELLFSDKSLRRNAYMEMKKRTEERNGSP